MIKLVDRNMAQKTAFLYLAKAARIVKSRSAASLSCAWLISSRVSAPPSCRRSTSRSVRTTVSTAMMYAIGNTMLGSRQDMKLETPVDPISSRSVGTSQVLDMHMCGGAFPPGPETNLPRYIASSVTVWICRGSRCRVST